MEALCVLWLSSEVLFQSLVQQPREVHLTGVVTPLT